jgi:hypothetical protein
MRLSVRAISNRVAPMRLSVSEATNIRWDNWHHAAAASVLVLLGASGAHATDTKIPLNYNAHVLARSTEAAQGATALNADVATNQARSPRDRGIYFDTTDPNALGGLPLVGATGFAYDLFNTM